MGKLGQVSRNIRNKNGALRARQMSRSISRYVATPKMPPRSGYIGRVRHGSTAARQRAHSGFRAAASVLSSSRRLTTPDERVHHVVVGLAGASTACRRGGWDARAARRAVGATATAAEYGAQAVHREPGREARGSLDQPNERTSDPVAK